MLRVPITEEGWKAVRLRAQRFGLASEHIAQLELRDEETIVYHHVDGVKGNFTHATLTYDKENAVIEFRKSEDREARPLMESYDFLLALIPTLDPAS